MPSERAHRSRSSSPAALVKVIAAVLSGPTISHALMYNDISWVVLPAPAPAWMLISSVNSFSRDFEDFGHRSGDALAHGGRQHRSLSTSAASCSWPIPRRISHTAHRLSV